MYATVGLERTQREGIHRRARAAYEGDRSGSRWQLVALCAFYLGSWPPRVCRSRGPVRHPPGRRNGLWSATTRNRRGVA